MSTALDHETTLSETTLRVLRSMAAKVQQTQIRYPTEGEALDQLQTRDQIDAFVARFNKNYAEMARTFAMAMSYVATPGIRLWPDNGREDCLSLSGSLHGMGFGIIWRENADGTGTWSFHS